MEHPLFLIFVVLSVFCVKLSNQAPQALLNKNDSNIDEIVTESYSKSTTHSILGELTSSESLEISSISPNEVTKTEAVTGSQETTKKIEESSSVSDIVTMLDFTATPTIGDSSVSTEGTTQKRPDEEVVRYIPPLDPMKNMLMMAENKRVLNITENEKSTEKITTESLVTEKIETTSPNTELSSTPEIISNKTDVLKKSGDVLTEIQSTTLEAESSTSGVLDKTALSTTMKVPVDNVTEVISDSNRTEEQNDSIFNSNTEINTEGSEKVNANISAVTEKLDEASSTDSSEEYLESESTTFSLANQTSTPSNVIAEEKIDDTILSRSDEIDSENETAIPENSLEIMKTNISEKGEIESSFESNSTNPIENLEKLSASEDEKVKNISLEEDLEFKNADLPLEESNVVYSEESNRTMESEVAENDAEETESRNLPEQEQTTPNILTTVADFVLSSTTTILSTLGGSESPSKNATDLVLEFNQTEPSVTESDLGVVLREELPEIHKGELEKSNMETIPAVENVTTVSPASSEKVSEISKEEPNKSLVLTTTEYSTSTELLSTELKEQEIPVTDSEISENNTKPLVELLSNSAMLLNTSSKEQPEENSIIEHKKHVNNRYVSGNKTDTIAAVQFLHYHDKTSSEQCFKLVDAHWNYATNLTDENKKKQLEQTLEYSLFHKEAWKNATSFAWKAFNDTHLRRWFKSLSVLGTAALPEDKLNEFNRLKAEMKNTYSTAKVCPYISPDARKNGEIENPKSCNLTLEPDLQRILTKSRDYDELTHVWKAWRDAAGKPIREKYLRFVNLSNEAALLNGFSDTGDMWREAYESDTFNDDLEALWDQLKPLYQHLHAYVRRRLIRQYGADKIKENGPIPAHLFGNMWAQSWVSLLDIAQPYLGKPSVDVTPIMEAKNLSALEMFQISEEFFTSLGLKPMPAEFWKHSLIEKPKNREIICHASAWDFCNGKDYRIKQCTDITMEDLITVHHEMGHIQYFLQYARQPNVFREGANPGFHEAIGDVLALSVSTPTHLQKIGLLEEVADDPEGDLNFLLRTALDKVSFLPSGYLIDLWRWGLFSGEIKPEEMNTKWWGLRLKYQGICPPVKREDTDFDPGAKYHVPGNVPYIRYFVSFVIQFQFHKVLCEAAGHTGPLYKCDIYRSKEAGQILSQVMELGSSEHWSEAMKIMTGGATNKMDAGPILEYFQPLMEYFKEQNKNETLGWYSNDSTICP
ncbi:angiotensin-converting enzyme [Parasteatoda tepidariorum]|nr:inactive angiotensin-converting enzyme-related protein [Parasteatoda tepidariorum]